MGMHRLPMSNKKDARLIWVKLFFLNQNMLWVDQELSQDVSFKQPNQRLKLMDKEMFATVCSMRQVHYQFRGVG